MHLKLVMIKFLFLATVACFGGQDEKSPSTHAPNAAVPAPPEAVQSLPAKSRETKIAVPTTPNNAADEAAIRATAETFALAYQAGDARNLAAHFTVEAEFVDEQGQVIQGREAIEQSLTEFFSEHPECKLETSIDSIRFVSPCVAIEDGSTTMTCPEKSSPVECRYTTVHVKVDGKWLTASVRDQAPANLKEHRDQLQQLGWLTGDWVDEGDDSIVNFSCEPIDGGSFLMRTFTIVVSGQEAMTGTQRIGWDPLTSKFRTWIFDSEGAYGEGTWSRDGDNWVLKCTGVMADGQTASSTSIYTPVNEHTMTWQSVDHEIGGVRQPDSEIVTIVRQAPVPEPVIATEGQ